MPRKDAYSGPISAQAQQDLVSEGIENFELPRSIVTKIAKSALPENAKLQKETVLSLVKGSTVFINYLAATAHDVATSKQHKSISASDVLKALEMIEFGDLINPLQEELNVYRELAKTDKSKKGMVNLNPSSASAAGKKTPTTSTGGPSISISLSKLKGKDKDKEKPSAAGNPMPPPFTSVPLLSAASRAESISDAGPGPMDVDNELPAGTNHISENVDPLVDHNDSERETLES